MLFYWGYPEELSSVAEQGLAFYPDDVTFGKYYGVALAGTGRLQDALEATRNHVRRHPENPDAWDDLGLRWLSLGRADSAEAAFHQALEIDHEIVYRFLFGQIADQQHRPIVELGSQDIQVPILIDIEDRC